MMQKYSQYGQDTFVYENFFKNKNDGFFVDIGAYDGVSLSNTLSLEELGWSGLCFEPIPEIFKTLEINRPGSQCFQKAIGHENKNVEFLRVTGYAEMLSGVLDYYDSRHMFRINKETHENNGKQDGIIVEMCTLDQFIVPGTKIDFLSIDTEGGEHYILENILKYFSPQIITVEVNYPNEAEKIVNVIKEKYDIVKQLGCDLILKSK